MLTPARAQTILSFTLTTLAVLTALMLLVFLCGAFTSGDRTQTVFSVNIPLELTLSLPGGRYDVSTFHLPLGDLPLRIGDAGETGRDDEAGRQRPDERIRPGKGIERFGAKEQL